MATNLPSCFSIEFLEQLLKFLVNFTLLKFVKSQRSYSFLITKELIFGFQILDLKDHFSSLIQVMTVPSPHRVQEENHAQFDLKIKLKLMQSQDRFNWSGQECLLDNTAIIIFQMISCREVLYSIKTLSEDLPTL